MSKRCLGVKLVPVSSITAPVHIAGSCCCSGSSQRPGDYLRIHYKVNGKPVMHDAAALHRPEFHIRSPWMNSMLSWMVGHPPPTPNLMDSMLLWMDSRAPPPPEPDGPSSHPEPLLDGHRNKSPKKQWPTSLVQ